MTDHGARRFRTLVALAVAVGAVLRVWWTTYATRTPTGLFDMARYLGYGERIADGQGYVEFTGHPTAYYPPGYPYFVGAITWLASPFTDDATRAVAGVQVVLGTATIVLVAYVTRRLAGRTAGVTAAAVYALYPNLVMHTGVLLGETLNIFFTMLFLALVLRRPVAEEQRWPWVLGAGVALGLSLLVRPVSGALVAVVVASWWWARRGDRMAVLRSTALIAAGIAVCVVPWVVRNAVRMDAFVPMSTNTGDNLCIGYQPDAIGAFSFNEYCAIGDPFQGPASEIATDEAKTSYALEQIREDPGRVPWLVWRRTWYTWFHSGDHDAITASQDFYTQPWMPADTRDRLVRTADLVYWTTLVVGAVGLVVLGARRRPDGWVLVGSFLVTATLPLAFFGESRFKVPALPFLVVGVGVAVAAVVEVLRTRSPVAEDVAAGA